MRHLLCLLVASAPAIAGGVRELHVGVAFRLHEKYDTTVPMLISGIETARAMFEEKHPGVRIHLHSTSYGMDAPSIGAAARQLVREGVPAILGGETSDETILLTEGIGAAPIVLMTPTSSSPSVTEGKPYVFRACFSDAQVAVKMAEFVVERLHPKKVGILHNVSSPYSDYLSTRFAERLKTLPGGPAEIITEKVVRRTMNLRPVVAKIEGAGAGVVAMFTHDFDLLNYLAQSHRSEETVFVGSDGWGSNQYVLDRIVRGSPQGKYFVGYRNYYWREDDDSAASTAFRTHYLAKYGKAPNAWSAIAFDSAWVLFTAMSQAAEPKKAADIKAKLEALQSKELVTTREFAFQADHSPLRDLFVYRIDRHGVRFEKTLPARSAR